MSKKDDNDKYMEALGWLLCIYILLAWTSPWWSELFS